VDGACRGPTGGDVPHAARAARLFPPLV